VVSATSPASAKPTETVTLMGTGLAGITSVVLTAAGVTTSIASVTATANTVKFTVPAIANGSYTITLMPGPVPAPSLTVVSPEKPIIDSVYPTTTYPVANRFSFDVNGQHFDPDPAKDEIDVLGQGPIEFKSRHAVPAPPAPAPGAIVACDKEPDDKQPCLEATADGRKLLVYGYRRRSDYQGPMKLQVFVNKVPSDLSAPLTLSRLDPRLVVGIALAVFALFMYIVFKLVTKGSKGYMVAGRPYSPLAAFLIDKSTDTYSLSKFQLFALSMVSFFGYIYVFLCRALVQWNFAFPEIPENYPSLLAISAGTTAAAIGLNSSRGGNGGGPVHPSAADFISSGGLVVADRFQFFMWTLIACFGFIALILLQDPATINGFPSFPSGLLYVMGVSAGGYLGGKAVRNPGPVLKQVQVSVNAATPNDLDVVLLGQCLDVNAKYRIDGAIQVPVGAVGSVPQPQAPTGFCSQLSFKLTGAAGFLTGDHVFEIVNGDGVGAEANFTGTPMQIVPLAYSVAAGGAPVPVSLLVREFRERLSAKWLAPGAADASEIPVGPNVTISPLVAGGPIPATIPAPAALVVPPRSAEVRIMLTPGTVTGKGLLTLVTEKGNTEAVNVTV
jgi:hypothetical protein